MRCRCCQGITLMATFATSVPRIAVVFVAAIAMASNASPRVDRPLLSAAVSSVLFDDEPLLVCCGYHDSSMWWPARGRARDTGWAWGLLRLSVNVRRPRLAAAQTVVARTSAPDSTKRASRSHLLRAPETAWEIDTSPRLAKVSRLIVRPSIEWGVRA